jgi:hypothetical protein
MNEPRSGSSSPRDELNLIPLIAFTLIDAARAPQQPATIARTDTSVCPGDTLV